MVTSSLMAAAPDQVTVLIFEHAWIEDMNVAAGERLLQQLVASRASVERFAGTVRLIFDGFDDDPRPLWDIEPVRVWFRMLTVAFPYWLVFLDRTHPEVPLVFNLLAGPGTPTMLDGVEPAREHSTAAIGEVLRDLFCGMNQLCARFGIPLETNNRWTAEISQVLDAFTG